MEQVIAFLAVLLPLTLSPGPVTITMAGAGMSVGIVRTLPLYAGIVLAAFVIGAVCGLGLNELFLADARVYAAIRYAGIAYIVYLGWKFLRARPSPTEPGAAPAGLVDGLLLTALNPKFYVMVVAVFSQFLRPGEGAMWLLVFGLAATIAGSAFAWLLAGASLRPLLRSARALRIQAVSFGVLLLAVAAYMALQG